MKQSFGSAWTFALTEALYQHHGQTEVRRLLTAGPRSRCAGGLHRLSPAVLRTRGREARLQLKPRRANRSTKGLSGSFEDRYKYNLKADVVSLSPCLFTSTEENSSVENRRFEYGLLIRFFPVINPELFITFASTVLWRLTDTYQHKIAIMAQQPANGFTPGTWKQWLLLDRFAGFKRK